MSMLQIASLLPGGVRTTIAKHHGRYSKSDHLCQDGVEWKSRLRSEYSLTRNTFSQKSREAKRVSSKNKK